MGRRRLKFVVVIGILFVTVAWLGVSGFEDGKAYFKTADEFVQMEREDQGRRIRLMGEVPSGSIAWTDGILTFTVALNGASVPVVYRGKDPVPDTFKDGASVLVEGTLGDDGRFVGKKIQAKCASKYEADPAAAYSQAAGTS